MVPVLFACASSPYRELGCDVYDIDRDARTWPGGAPCIAHPPCRAWGKLRHLAKPRDDERELSLWAIDRVRTFGGVLEHPLHSRLWSASDCLGWGIRDRFGGVLVPVAQSAFGHRAQKLTGLYLVGIEVPSIPLEKPAQTTVERMGRPERERTPFELASWLVDLVRGVGR